MQRTPTMVVLLLIVVVTTSGCGLGIAGQVDTPTGSNPAAGIPGATAGPIGPTTTTTTTTTPATPGTTTTSTSGPAAPVTDPDEIDALLAGLDETLTELDQFLNQAAAALAAEEAEILP